MRTPRATMGWTSPLVPNAASRILMSVGFSGRRRPSLIARAETAGTHQAAAGTQQAATGTQQTTGTKPSGGRHIDCSDPGVGLISIPGREDFDAAQSIEKLS